MIARLRRNEGRLATTCAAEPATEMARSFFNENPGLAMWRIGASNACSKNAGGFLV